MAVRGRIGVGRFLPTLAMVMWSGVSWADNPFSMQDNPNPAAAERQRQINKIVDACEGIQQQMANRATAQRDKVYYYAHDYNAKDGFILNSPLQVYMRDVRQELDRTRQQFHRLKYRDDTQIADCVNLGEETRKRLDCFYDHTVKNDVPGMRSCSDIYDIYVDPDRYYGGTAPQK